MTRYPSAAALLPIALALTACAERTDPDPTPAKDGGPYNMIDPVRVDDPAGAAATTAGVWRPDTAEGAQAVAFVRPQGEVAFMLYCDGRQGIVVERRGVPPAGPVQMMTITVDGADRRLAVNPVGEGQSVLCAVLPLNEDVAASLQEGPTPISVNVGKGEVLRLPPSPLVAMLASDCARE